MEPLSLKWEFEPVLNLQKFNSIISNIKTTLSKLGDNANVLDEKSLVDIFKKVELQSDKTGKAIKEDFTEAKSAISGISVASKSVDKDFDTLNKGLENTGEVAKNLLKRIVKSQFYFINFGNKSNCIIRKAKTDYIYSINKS